MLDPLEGADRCFAQAHVTMSAVVHWMVRCGGLELTTHRAEFICRRDAR
jgi:hypothetical protein